MLKPEDIKIQMVEYQHGVVEYHVLVRKFKRNWRLERVPTDEFVLSSTFDDKDIFLFPNQALAHRNFLLDEYYRSLPAKTTQL